MAIIQCPECRKEVSENAVMCPYCGYGVKNHFDSIRNLEFQKELQERKKQRSRKVKRNLTILIPICIVVIAVCIGLVVNHRILSERMTFKNEKEMLKYLTSYKSWEMDHAQRDDWLIFYGNGFCQEVSSELSSEYGNHQGKIEMNPRRGIFELGGSECAILKNGNIVETFKGFNDLKSVYYYEPSNYSPDAETFEKALEIEILSNELSGNFLVTDIKVTNNGKNTYEDIAIEGVLYNGDDVQILEHKGYVKNDYGEYVLEPQQSGICKIVGEVEEGFDSNNIKFGMNTLCVKK